MAINDNIDTLKNNVEKARIRNVEKVSYYPGRIYSYYGPLSSTKTVQGPGEIILIAASYNSVSISVDGSTLSFSGDSNLGVVLKDGYIPYKYGSSLGYRSFQTGNFVYSLEFPTNTEPLYFNNSFKITSLVSSAPIHVVYYLYK